MKIKTLKELYHKSEELRLRGVAGELVVYTPSHAHQLKAQFTSLVAEADQLLISSALKALFQLAFAIQPL